MQYYWLSFSIYDMFYIYNYTISGMSNKNKLDDIFAGRGFKMVGVMVLSVYEIPLIAIVHHAGGQMVTDIAPVVEDKTNIDVDTDKIHSVSDKKAIRKERWSEAMKMTFTTFCKYSHWFSSSVIAYCISSRCRYA
ncbi:hypothetical protein FNV43_RR05554 [Rhamnella rubrinervis]|uniref:Uncharacterized protein n=1 Tax=Rhamnella rubrinervis TaxID=2594499 RepID=A0A8K0MQJ6_9ROSA|nr:hypothetical protein FNV43_RR05554 [Rhamnella rubrinervis]